MSDQEAQRIYGTLFDAPIPPVVAERFADASARLDAGAPPAELRAYRQAVADAVDLEALELAARWTRCLPLLTRKLQLMAFLAETLPENQSLFINHRDNLPLALVQVSVAALRTGALMVKGLFLVRRYGAGGAR